MLEEANRSLLSKSKKSGSICSLKLVVMTVVSYVGHRYFSFRRKAPVEADPSARVEGEIDAPAESPKGEKRSAGKVAGS